MRSRGKLPHWEEHYAIYFVTFRLADSLPQSVLQKFEFERRNIIATAKASGRALSSFERTRLEELFSEQIEQKLDTGAGGCLLANAAVAAQVTETLRHFDQVRYHPVCMVHYAQSRACVVQACRRLRVGRGSTHMEILLGEKCESTAATDGKILAARILRSLDSKRRRILSDGYIHLAQSEKGGVAKLAVGRDGA